MEFTFNSLFILDSSLGLLLKKSQVEKTTLSSGFSIIWHLPSFPQSSIIGATGLDFCVRNDNRYYPSAMGTKS